MGTSTFANHTVVPEIALAKIREDAPFDKVCYIGCGVTTGIGAVFNTATEQPGDNAVVFGLGGTGLHATGGASCRERVCLNVYISVVAVPLTKKHNIIKR